MKNEKNQDKLQDAIGMIDQKLIARASKQPMKYTTKIKWISSVAAVLVVCIVFGVLMGNGVLSSPWNTVPNLPLTGQLVAAKYPQMTQYPGEGNYKSEAYRQWDAERQAQRSYFGAGEALSPFFERTIAQFMSDATEENVVYSPINVYMALAMIAETASGNTRAQILELLGAESIESLRTQTHAVWNANYRDDGLVTSVIANSLWMNEGYSFRQDTLNLLAESYYASSYSGDMGSDDYNQMLRDWLNEQTRGALKEQIDALELTADTVMALVSTVYFCAFWEEKFFESE
ncbi:MAG: hypothetical protein IJX80_04520, partial [Clostridia bacterium]|nr:hypothetical protein [Clostridia bacterium]